MRRSVIVTFFFLLLSIGIQGQSVTQGQLAAVDKAGKALGMCPLKNTAVRAEISGFLSRVRVMQEFENNFSEKIEAVYVFPLPQNAAVDDMTMRIGERVVRGKIMKREEAREVYEAARSNGQIASLLDQERPNIFTQSVANILPGEKVTIEISYVETLKYEDGAYEFVFPMVVGPRYIPGNAKGKQGGGFAPDTDRVPDGSRITPKVAKDRAGHDISIDVQLDAGVAIESVASKSHEIELAMLSPGSYDVKLKSGTTIPNKDFILRYDVAGKRISDAVLTHRSARGGFFTLILQPPDTYRPQDVTPKEIVFVLDTSGSMSGFPIEKAKESMKLALEGLNPQDTFNLITFAGDTAILFPEPVPATPDNLARAKAFLSSRQGGGGTEMMKAIRAALDPSDSLRHIRVVCFMTDGYVGNEAEIIAEIQKHPNARVFSFGIGNSVNRYLLDEMAEEGRGEVEYVSLNDDGSAAARRFHERVRSPLLTDISVDFGSLQVSDVYPKRINDLFSAKPVLIHGRYTGGGSGTIKLMGRSSGSEVVREIAVNLPESDPTHDVLATLWARTRIDDLTSQDHTNEKPEIRNAITNLGLEFRLMTQFTSFVAVEERVVTDGGQPRKIEVPVEMPDGVSREGVFGEYERPTGSLAVASGFSLPSSQPHGYIVQSIAGRRKVRAEIVNQYANVSSIALYKTTSDGKQVRLDSSAANISTSIRVSSPQKPSYPTKLKAPVTVEVEVSVDSSGNVTAAKALSGDASLHADAEAAARNTKFGIPKTHDEIVKVKGVMSYFYGADKTVTVSDYLDVREMEVKPNKYHSSVRTVVEDIKAGRQNQTASFIRDGKADVVVRLSELKPEAIEQLKNLGFEVVTEMASAKAVVGRIPIGKLEALAALDVVTFVSP